MNRQLLFHPRGGAAGWLAFPFYVLFEALSPILEVIGYAGMILGLVLGVFSWEAFSTLMLLTILFGILLSVSALLLEEMSFHMYPKPAQLARLFASAIIENFGYRQINTFWRFQGTMRWLVGARQRWGEMTRSGALNADKGPGSR
jgi:hypothetical protein